MIVLFTDFGIEGPYVGQMKSVIETHAPGSVVIDLLHEAPSYDIKTSAYFLAALVAEFPPDAIFVCIVDPGVGGERKPIVSKIGEQWFVGPDNGLFNVVAMHAEEPEKIESWTIDWQPERLSSSFHGRDLFAPVAAMLEKGESVPGAPYTYNFLKSAWPPDLSRIIYIDHFGNAMTGLRANFLTSNQTISINGFRFGWARTFSDVNLGEGFWSINSNGLIEISVNQGSARTKFNLEIGDEVCVAIH